MKAQKNTGEEKREMTAQKFWVKALITALVLGLTQSCYADLVQLDLFSIGCKSTYDYDSPSWTSDLDLGVTFTEISHVYIDWSGEITGGLAIDYDDPDNPFSIDLGIGIYLESPPSWRHVSLWGGESTYPNPDPFNCQSEFIYGSMPWSELYDGKITITVEHKELVIIDGEYIEHGSIYLDTATLVVDGVIIPEPVTVLLLATGIIAIRHMHHKNRNPFIEK